MIGKKDLNYKIWYLGIILIPISLIFPLKVNGVIIGLVALMGIIAIIKKSPKPSRRSKLFLILSSFYIISYCVGSCIDVFKGVFDISRLERLLPFLIFPILMLFVVDKRINSKQILRHYAYFITGVSSLLLISSLALFLSSINEDPVLSKIWKKSGSIVSLDQEIRTPNGKIGAVKLTENENYESHNLIKEVFSSSLGGVNYYRSIFVKSAEKHWILLRQFDGETHKGAWFNVEDGFVGKTQEGVSANIEDFGNGWFRCTLFNKTSKNAIQERLQLTIVDNNGKYVHQGDGKSGVYVWGGIIGIGSKIPDDLPNNRTLNYSQFFGKELMKPIQVHPTYYGLFLILAELVLLIRIIHRFDFLHFTAFLFNAVIIILLASKGIILSFLTAFFIITLLTVWNQPKKFSILILGLLTFALLILFTPKTYERFEQSINTVTLNKDDELSTSGRLKVWKSILELDTYKLLVGFGNEKGEIILREKTKSSLNAHNQYLQAILGGGIISLLLLLAYIFSPLVNIRSYSNDTKILVLAFVVVIFINCFFESLLNRQWGIVFISYFYSLFYRQGYLQESSVG